MSKSASPRKRPAAKKKKAVAAKKSSRKSATSSKTKSSDNGDNNSWILRLYVAGQTPKSLTAFANLKRMCEQHLKGLYKIEFIDLVQQPALAASDQIVALPTLVRRLPAPIKRVVGDLSNSEKVIVGMDLMTGAF